jgi:hypothetical protein
MPAFLSQLVVPILLIFCPWYWLLGSVLLAGFVWSTVRYRLVSVPFADGACLAVAWLKWPLAIGSAIILCCQAKFILGIVALLWPLGLAGYFGIPGKVGVVELAFAKKIGYISEDNGDRDEL